MRYSSNARSLRARASLPASQAAGVLLAFTLCDRLSMPAPVSFRAFHICARFSGAAQSRGATSSAVRVLPISVTGKISTL